MESIYQHIQKRVLELGYANYSVQPVIVKTQTGQLEYEISAYNELYFLMGKVPDQTRIISDTHAMLIDENFNNAAIKPFCEFSGFIEIKLSQETTQGLEFLKVILS